jgi:S-adenosylmethionine/arginine decarboxylase-like enzyme
MLIISHKHFAYINLLLYDNCNDCIYRTIALETGIQNSAMAQGLARTTIGIENTATAAVSGNNINNTQHLCIHTLSDM